MSKVNSLTLYANEVLKGQLFDSWQHTRVFTYKMSHFSSVNRVDQIFVFCGWTSEASETTLSSSKSISAKKKKKEKIV